MIPLLSGGNQSAVRDTFGSGVIADIAKRNMALFEGATQAFSGKTRDEPPKSSNKEVDALRAELEALRAKVDKLSR